MNTPTVSNRLDQPMLDRPTLEQRLRKQLLASRQPRSSYNQLVGLVVAGFDQLPLPASGRTLERWQVLAAVAEHDLSVAKLFEGHTDALAIFKELGAHLPDDGATWGVWASESTEARVVIDVIGDGLCVLNGKKLWCSGAENIGNALITGWHADGSGPQLVHIALAQPGVSVSHSNWHAVGMAGSCSLDVSLENATGRLIGESGSYLSRAGFWQGGAGVAVCWYGGASALGNTLRQSVREAAPSLTDFKLAALGKVHLQLCTAATSMRQTANWIDRNPLANAHAHALQLRLVVERCAHQVLRLVGEAMGATPFCRDAHFARMSADLPVFIRQSSAERDYACLGEYSAKSNACPWLL